MSEIPNREEEKNGDLEKFGASEIFVGREIPEVEVKDKAKETPNERFERRRGDARQMVKKLAAELKCDNEKLLEQIEALVVFKNLGKDEVVDNGKQELKKIYGERSVETIILLADKMIEISKDFQKDEERKINEMDENIVKI